MKNKSVPPRLRKQFVIYLVLKLSSSSLDLARIFYFWFYLTVGKQIKRIRRSQVLPGAVE